MGLTDGKFGRQDSARYRASGSRRGVEPALFAAIVIFLGHSYGVVILGVYALAVTISQCLQPIIDFGLRHIGARLMAKYPEQARKSSGASKSGGC